MNGNELKNSVLLECHKNVEENAYDYMTLDRVKTHDQLLRFPRMLMK